MPYTQIVYNSRTKVGISNQNTYTTLHIIYILEKQ